MKRKIPSVKSLQKQYTVVHVTKLTSFQLMFRNKVQTFRIGPQWDESKAAEWFSKMFAKALQQVIKDHHEKETNQSKNHTA